MIDFFIWSQYFLLYWMTGSLFLSCYLISSLTRATQKWLVGWIRWSLCSIGRLCSASCPGLTGLWRTWPLHLQNPGTRSRYRTVQTYIIKTKQTLLLSISFCINVSKKRERKSINIERKTKWWRHTNVSLHGGIDHQVSSQFISIKPTVNCDFYFVLWSLLASSD